MSVTNPAADRWRQQLEAWAIPDEILRGAPESPYGFSVDTFSRIADEALEQRPDAATRRALEALPAGGDVLDVGCGAGAASLPLAARAGGLVGVDESADLLAAFVERADRLGVHHSEVHGRWPDVADRVPAADVVVTRHVVYNVPDLGDFVVRLTDHARHRVVVHLHGAHPMTWTAPYWERMHGLERPAGPKVDDAIAVAESVGLAVAVEPGEEEFGIGGATEEEQVAFLRRRLCLGHDRDRELYEAVRELGVPNPRPVATLWWPGTAVA
ncbi:MAG: class I SAM-dependent methyltransferase [Acidimicrobiales bacterium]